MTIDLKQQAKEATSAKLETTKEYAQLLLRDGRRAMEDKRRNNELYQAGRRDQIKLGLRAPNSHEVGQGIRRKWDADAKGEGTLTQAQITALAEFSSLEQLKAMTAAQVVQSSTHGSKTARAVSIKNFRPVSPT